MREHIRRTCYWHPKDSILPLNVRNAVVQECKGMSGLSHWLACAHMLRGDIAEGIVAQGSFNPAETVCFFFKAGTPSAGLGANRSNRKIHGVNEILDLQVLKAHVEARRFAKYWQILLEMVNIFEKNEAVGTTPRDSRGCDRNCETEGPTQSN